jgi:hypothetical protein
MERNADTLRDLGVEPLRVEWREAPPKGDAADFIGLGGTPDDLAEMLSAATSYLTAAESLTVAPR